MTYNIAGLGLIALVLFGSGCTTLVQDRRNDEMRHRMENQRLRADVDRLSQRLDGVVEAQQDCYREVRTIDDSLQKKGAVTDGRLDALEQQVSGGAAAREAMKRELVGTLSGRITEAINSSPVATQSSENGYEHSVRAGETLSEIAAAYGVTVPALIKANRLTNPDSLRIGQKLFIPE